MQELLVVSSTCPGVRALVQNLGYVLAGPPSRHGSITWGGRGARSQRTGYQPPPPDPLSPPPAPNRPATGTAVLGTPAASLSNAYHPSSKRMSVSHNSVKKIPFVHISAGFHLPSDWTLHICSWVNPLQTEVVRASFMAGLFHQQSCPSLRCQARSGQSLQGWWAMVWCLCQRWQAAFARSRGALVQGPIRPSQFRQR